MSCVPLAVSCRAAARLLTLRALQTCAVVGLVAAQDKNSTYGEIVCKGKEKRDLCLAWGNRVGTCINTDDDAKLECVSKLCS